MADDEEFSLPLATGPYPGADPTMDWGAVIRAAKWKPDDEKARLEGIAKPREALEPGREVPLESVLKFNKDHSLNTQSNIGKVVELVIELKGQVKAGRSKVYTGEKVAPVKVKIEGRQSLVTQDYILKPGKVVDFVWIEARVLRPDGKVAKITVSDGKIWLDKDQVTWDQLREELLNA